MGRRWWAGPGLGGPARPINFDMMGRGPARPVKFSEDGSRPGRARHFSEDGPRPGPVHHIFKNPQPGPARPIIFSKVSARPGPAHHMAARPMKHGLYMGRPGNYVARPVNLTGRPIMCCTVLKGACAYADVIFSCSLLVFRCFLPSGFRGTAAFCP